MPKLDPADQVATSTFTGFSTPAVASTTNIGTTTTVVAPQANQYQSTDTSAFSDAIEASEHKPEEHWMKSFWRPAMGWLYMLTCFCDFVAFPVLWGLLQAFMHMHDTGTIQITQWNPITLQGAGLYHLAMGAILGIAAYGRTQEKKTGTT
jgi:hypothetical protein